MADLKQCDTCGVISPNNKGEYIANHWTTMRVVYAEGLRSSRTTDFLVCCDCIARGVKVSDTSGYPPHKAILVAD
jgi:hypothetical protein